MTNFTFGPEKRLSRLTLGRVEQLNALFAEIATVSATKVEFTLGNIDFNGGRAVNAANGVNPTDLVTKQQLDATAFAPALPGQAGNAGKFITTNGSAASWVDAPVRFDLAQLLTDPQKAQARANISAASVAELGSKADAAATVAALATKAEASAVALALNAKADKAIILTAGTGLTGGGDLSAGRTLSADIASQAEAEAGTDTTKIMTPQRARQAVAAYNKWETIQLLDFSNVASVVLTNLAAFRHLKLTGTFRPLVNGQDLRAQVSSNNGSSWLTTSSDYSYLAAISVNGTYSTNVSTGAVAVILGPANSNVISHAIETLFTDFNVNNGVKAVRTSTAYANSVPTGAVGTIYSGIIAGAYNALRLLAGSGNISGSVLVEGIRG